MRLNLLSLLLGLLVAIVQGPTVMAAQPNTIQLEAVSLTKTSALRLLGDPRLKSDPAAVLTHLRQMVKVGEGRAVAVTSLRQVLPFRGNNMDKPLSFEVDASAPDDGWVHINIALAAGNQPNTARLVTKMSAKLGTPHFLGTLEPEDPANQGLTWIIFLSIL